MAQVSNLNGICSEALPVTPQLPLIPASHRRVKTIAFSGRGTDSTENSQAQPLQLQTTRRAALGLASIALVETCRKRIALAGDNGYWITDLKLTAPSVDNNIVNEKTGTRSFLKKGVYVPELNTKNRMYKLKKNAFDLLAMQDLVTPDTLNYVKKYLRLKATTMYYDFDKVISAAAVNDKPALMALANRLFDSFEKLEDAAKSKDFEKTESCYRDTKVILEEVMVRMA